MGFPKTLLIASVAFFLLASTTVAPVTAQNLIQLQILGRVFCTATGNCLLPSGACPGLVGALVQVSCDGGQSIIAQGLTNNLGVFQLVGNLLSTTGLSLSNCVAQVRLPVASCTMLPSTATVLTSPLNVVGLVQTATGLVFRLTTPVFRLVA